MADALLFSARVKNIYNIYKSNKKKLSSLKKKTKSFSWLGLYKQPKKKQQPKNTDSDTVSTWPNSIVHVQRDLWFPLSLTARV